MDKNEETIVDIDDEKPARAAGAVIDEDAAQPVVDEDEDLEGGLPRRAVRNDDGTITLPLRETVTLKIRSKDRGEREEVFAELTFHRLKGADMNAVMAAAKEHQPKVMLARATRTREPIMNALWNEMDAADISDAAQVAAHFFGSGRTTGR